LSISPKTEGVKERGKKKKKKEEGVILNFPKLAARPVAQVPTEDHLSYTRGEGAVGEEGGGETGEEKKKVA